jgi:hypothetical protein
VSWLAEGVPLADIVTIRQVHRPLRFQMCFALLAAADRGHSNRMR